ncbi:MAG: acyl-CoA synthetase [Thermonemataceae bacterium]
MISILQQAQKNSQNTAIIDATGSYTYQQLLTKSLQIASYLQHQASFQQGDRVNFLAQPSFAYTTLLLGIWQAGGIAVPMCITHPTAELQYVLEDTGCKVLITDKQYYVKAKALAEQVDIQIIQYDAIENINTSLAFQPSSDGNALMIYTSGTTGKPKGVVTTHRNIESQIKTLVEAWRWSKEDSILHVLPLHHVHGIINVLACALWSGARCDFLTKFEAKTVWQLFIDRAYSLFMAVPTIYSRLIQEYEQSDNYVQQQMRKATQAMRLMVSGSAALPVTVLEKWENITSHTLLERYGMTEIGMALSNPYIGKRVAGYVGLPLPGVAIKLVDEQGDEVAQGEPGEIIVKGDSIFKEYWQREEATQNAFMQGWFKTGDIAQVNEEGYFKILGRQSVDIIKTGGYKVSALEIEEVLRTHPAIKECAVVGIENEEWGEVVSAAIQLHTQASLSLSQLRDWAKTLLAAYKIPRNLLIVEELPRNAMGKIVKPSVKYLFQENK